MCRQTVDFEAIHFIYVFLFDTIFLTISITQRKDLRPVAADGWCALKKKQTEKIVIVGL